MGLKWTEQEDNLLRQLEAIGLTSAKIYKEYSSVLQDRTQVAIRQRLAYLHKPPKERMKEDMASLDNADLIVKAIEESTNRICNRLDTIAKALQDTWKLAEEETKANESRSKSMIRLGEEIKANGVLQQGTQQSIKSELQRIAYKRNYNAGKQRN